MKRFLVFFVASFLLSISLSAQDSSNRILFFGDSITAGNGITKEKAFPALIQHKIDSLNWDYNAINAGLSGETSAGGLRRVDWMLRQPVSVFMLELGGNDGLRGIDLDATKKNLQKIIDKVEAKYPNAKIIIAGMEVPPNLGPEYTKKFKEMYPALAEENDAKLIPFLLEGVARDSDLMQADGIHPTAQGHKILAQTVWDTLKPMLLNMNK
ncbi:acyl-CoA thioesterase-1 [Fodinibius salinus]|uniref:Acyl-CoA thioesterase-1 n=1 Tax=Fodinibius salinus TaxID=860790 RepID=A0A5D3YP08_9BACT|nr:arylesterase [Fodinibius salinus]TYP95547.1 acyl-CoA thioesterase-1 [Fodinibius salinus]